jgi:sugar phosphate isomerase/epimerase
MTNRRSFLRNSGALIIGSAAFSKTSLASLLPRPMKKPVGLQLYTLFSTIDADVAGTLKKVADIGYKEIESAFSKKGGYYGMKPKEFNAMVKDMGMSWKSHHVLGAPFKLPPGAKMPLDAEGKPLVIPPMKTLRENYQELVDEAAEGGIPYLVCANTPIGSAEEIKSSIETLNKTAEACKKAGLLLAYHNHDREFKAVDDKVPYDLLLSETDPETLKMELDLCWVTKAGVDPVELFKKNPGRFHLWHVKDLDKEMTGPQPVGTGIVDFKRIFKHASEAGMKHFFVEHDSPKDAFASITQSFNYIKNEL